MTGMEELLSFVNGFALVGFDAGAPKTSPTRVTPGR
jgi:hypothetical protein